MNRLTRMCQVLWGRRSAISGPRSAVGRVPLTDKVSSEQRFEAGQEVGMACIWKKHIPGGENNQYHHPKEEACGAYLRPADLGTLSQGRKKRSEK